MKRLLIICLIPLVLSAANCGSGGQLRSESKKSFAFHYNLGMAAFDKGDYRSAATHFKRSISLNPNIARTHNDLGMCYLFLKENEKAIPEFERALELDPSLAETHNNLGIAFFSVGRYREAEQQFNATLSYSDYGTKFIPLFNLGNLYQKEGRYEQAITVYNTALEEEQKITLQYRISIHHQLGNALLAMDRYQDAYKHFEQALVLNPRLVEAAFNAGVAAYEYGDLKAARIMFAKAISIAPGTDWEEHANTYLAKMEQ